MNSTIQIRIDSKTKKDVKRVLDRLGLDVSSAVKMYFRQIVERRGLPFPILTENGFTPAQERQLVKEADETRKLYLQGKLKTFGSAKELLDDIIKNDG